tara:strand:- start:868 stop:2577 length:1710 start_codon:yes stop_codon:yes gene_type:complete
MRKLGIGYYLNSAATDMAYGSSDGSTASNATTPDLLVEGSIGMYGVLKTGVSTDLITGSSTLSLYSSFMIYQGGKGETILLSQFLGSELQTIDSAAYLCPTKQVSFVGYNGTSGSLNMGTTVAGDSGQIQLNQRSITNNPISSYFLIGDTGKLAAAATGYAALAPTLAQLNSTRGSNAPLKGTWQITSDATTLTAPTGVTTSAAQAVLLTKGSNVVTVKIGGSGGWGADTTTLTVAAGSVISVPHQSYKSFLFTADALGSSAGRHLITIGNTVYNVADAGAATANATAIAAAINAGTQAYASLPTSSTVLITLLPSIYSTKITATKSSDDSVFTAITPTYASSGATTTTTGDVVPTIYKVTTAWASDGTNGTYVLDYPFQGETGYYLQGTSFLYNTGIATVITEYGAKFTASNYFEEFTTQLNGILSNATLTYGTGVGVNTITNSSISATTTYPLKPTSGNGEYSEMRLLENYGRYYRGANDTYPAVSTTPQTYYTKTGKGYDNYSIVIKPMRVDGSGLNATSSNQYNLDMGFEHFNLTASTGDNQYVWEAILDLFVLAYPNLAYTSLV